MDDCCMHSCFACFVHKWPCTDSTAHRSISPGGGGPKKGLITNVIFRSRFFLQKIGIENSGVWLIPRVLEGVGSSGRLVGTISTIKNKMILIVHLCVNSFNPFLPPKPFQNTTKNQCKTHPNHPPKKNKHTQKYPPTPPKHKKSIWTKFKSSFLNGSLGSCLITINAV